LIRAENYNAANFFDPFPAIKKAGRNGFAVRVFRL
jgi:hypothetical protein